MSSRDGFDRTFASDSYALLDYRRMAITDASIYSSEQPYQFYQLAAILGKYLPQDPKTSMSTNAPRPGATGLDMTAHIGGFSIPWCKMCPAAQLLSVEQDAQAFQALSHNADTMRTKTQMQLFQGDSTSFLHFEANKVEFEFIYMDPPFGGPDYKYKEKLELEFAGKPLKTWIEPMMRKTALGVLKLPFNYHLPGLWKEVQRLKLQLTMYRVEYAAPGGRVPPNPPRAAFLVAVIERGKAGS